MTSRLQIIAEKEGEAALIILRGRIDIESSPQLRDELLALLGAQAPQETIAIDLVAVTYMDTSGIATLVEALKIARIRNIVVHLQGLQGRLLHLFQSTGIGSLFNIAGSPNKFSETRVY